MVLFQTVSDFKVSAVLTPNQRFRLLILGCIAAEKHIIRAEHRQEAYEVTPVRNGEYSEIMSIM